MNKKKGIQLILLVVSLLLIWLIVLSLRPHTVPVHLFYFPIILGAWYFSKRGGILVGFAAGILSGPLMYLEVESNINQTTLYWIIRLLFFIVFGGLLGILFQKMREDTIQLTNHRKELEIQRKFANVDGLTLIPNRRKFNTVLEEEHKKISKEVTPLSLIMMDIDEFKAFNDNYGHIEGDECLKVVADTVQSLLRKEDFIARYGGEEFVVILPKTDQIEAENIAKQIITGMMELNYEHLYSNTKPYITLSLGVATIFESSDCSPSELMQRADRALYRAKSNGRDRVEIFEKI
ncbi:GGDEF domain-containing protein [Saliterribacillus persicus]|uniref:Diguanylate cyclase (GGDEF)-like protein n=1 Tax=Saliterribacillus persicus TaxID=930114 RepID=A0A368XPI7_9BACI|nr:GGDEF domain-containing protein [Saliterribacillus persicus]RCW69775.1 diguanylate cyclase (GGDEF)-like protein [Saliterribacillus persicus]